MKKNTLSTPFLSGGALHLLAGLLFLVCILAGPALAEDPKGLMEVDLSVKPDPLAKDVETGLDHLFAVMDGDNSLLDTTKVSSLLDFVINNSADPKDIEPAKRFRGRGVCLRYEVDAGLDKILRYFYNPDIPNYLLCPAVLRLSGWHKDSQFLKRDKGLWDELPTLNKPVIVRGKEFEANTPDSFAEAYYKYDIDRLLILLKHNGHNVLVSVSRQAGKSEVGRKGAILDDQKWDYFYSGIEGLNRGMIGWMDTFMYTSGSVQVFAELDKDAPRSAIFLFKWLNAGWAGMNVVKRSHIYDGSLRYARSFTKVVQDLTLSPEDVAENMQAVANMPEARMDTLIQQYARNFETRFKDNPKLKKGDYAEVIENGGYAAVLDTEARRSVLALEKLKSLLGMETLVSMDGLIQPVGANPAETADKLAQVSAQPKS